MGKTQREEISGGREERKAPKLETSSERTLIVVSPLHLFGIKINTNTNPNPNRTEEAEFIWTKLLPNHWMGLAEFDSKKILVGGEKLFDGRPADPLYSHLEFDDVMSAEIYELKKVGNDAIDIAPSDSIPRLNEGKGMPIVETFGGKIYALHTTSFLKLPYLYGEDYIPGVFEVFDPSFTSKNWVVKMDTYFHDFLKRCERYEVLRYCRIGDKLYFHCAGGDFFYCIFDLKTEKWSMDEHYYPSLSELKLPLSGFSVSVPGLNVGHVILSWGQGFYEAWPKFFASFLTKGERLLCYQTVHKIFSFDAVRGLTDVNCKFLEVGNGEFCGIFTGREAEFSPGAVGPIDIEPRKIYLFISIFTLQAITPPPSSHPLYEPEEINFLHVYVKNQQRFDITGYDCARVVDATFL